jgi:hypothetical protein
LWSQVPIPHKRREIETNVRQGKKPNKVPLKQTNVNGYCRVFLKVTLSLGLLSPPIPSLSEVSKVRKFYIKLGYAMLKLSI